MNQFINYVTSIVALNKEKSIYQNGCCHSKWVIYRSHLTAHALPVTIDFQTQDSFIYKVNSYSSTRIMIESMLYCTIPIWIAPLYEKNSDIASYGRGNMWSSEAFHHVQVYQNNHFKIFLNQICIILQSTISALFKSILIAKQFKMLVLNLQIGQSNIWFLGLVLCIYKVRYNILILVGFPDSGTRKRNQTGYNQRNLGFVYQISDQST